MLNIYMQFEQQHHVARCGSRSETSTVVLINCSQSKWSGNVLSVFSLQRLTVTQLDGKFFACERPKIPLPYFQNFSLYSNTVKALKSSVSKVNYPPHLGHSSAQC